MTNRDEYLASAPQYPLLEGEVLTPAEWRESLAGSCWVMGRWAGAANTLILDGQTFNPPPGEATGFLRSWWKVGDWLAVRVERAVEGHWTWSETTLLAPCDGDPIFPQNVEIKFEFARFLEEVKNFFRQKGFEEVLTPSLVLCPGTEVYVDPFTVRGVKEESYYLPTSPEIHLKKALAQGRSKVFEVAKVFRAGEVTQHHREEFWMLEWYRVQVPLLRLFDDLKELISFLGEAPVEDEKHSIADLFQRHLHVDLTPETTADSLRKWCDERKISHSRDDSYSDLFHRLFLEFVEPHLVSGGLTLVYDYPPQLAAYARLNPKGWAQRQEVYWRGMELANGFFEVCSAQEQLGRMAADNEAKRKRGASPVGMDPDFYLHLRQGFPACSGMALGLDRLFMALKGVKNIGELRSF